MGIASKSIRVAAAVMTLGTSEIALRALKKKSDGQEETQPGDVEPETQETPMPENVPAPVIPPPVAAPSSVTPLAANTPVATVTVTAAPPPALNLPDLSALASAPTPAELLAASTAKIEADAKAQVDAARREVAQSAESFRLACEEHARLRLDRDFWKSRADQLEAYANQATAALKRHGLIK